MKLLSDAKQKEAQRGRNLLVKMAIALASVSAFSMEAPSRAQETLPNPAKVPQSPDPQRVFRLESEGTLLERMAEEARQGKNPLGLRYEFVYPSYPPVPPPAFLARNWEPLPEIIEPAYLCYGRLYFEQLNAERYGWDLGPLHPLISAGVFYFDLATLPYHAATEPLRRYECNTGYALPGDPMPLLLYRPEWSLTGTLAEAAAIGLMFVIFP
jgi:hypothetical protein